MPCVARSVSLAAALTMICISSAALAQVVSTPEFQNEEPVAVTSTSITSSASTEVMKGAAADNRGTIANGSIRPFSTVGIGVNVSTLGIGFQVATPLAQKLNLRGGGSFFTYNAGSYSGDGITYTGQLQLRSGEALLDWFPFGGGFHLSPGVQFYNGFNAAATLNVPGGQNFTLNSVSYTSSNAVPITGTATLGANKAAPMFMFGFGNLVPRRKHFSVLAEFGFAYQGDVKVGFALAGNACNSGTQVNCRNVATDPTIQSNITAQKTVIQNDVDPYAKFYPIIRLGFGYKF